MKFIDATVVEIDASGGITLRNNSGPGSVTSINRVSGKMLGQRIQLDSPVLLCRLGDSEDQFLLNECSLSNKQINHQTLDIKEAIETSESKMVKPV